MGYLTSDIIQQINFYREFHFCDFWILATTYPIFENDLRILENEKIAHVELDNLFRRWCRERKENLPVSGILPFDIGETPKENPSVVEKLSEPTISTVSNLVVQTSLSPSERLDAARGILNWLQIAKVGIRLKNGQPVVKFPADPTIDRAEVLDELRAYRLELIHLLRDNLGEPRPTPWGSKIESAPGAPAIEAFGPPGAPGSSQEDFRGPGGWIAPAKSENAATGLVAAPTQKQPNFANFDEFDSGAI